MIKAHLSRNSKAYLIVLASVILIALFVRVRFNGDLDGLFLLSRQDGFGIVLQDDVYVEDAGRLLYHVELEPLWRRYRMLRARISGRSYLDAEWHEEDGRGFIRNYFPDGTRLIVTFGRALDDTGRRYHGLFVGGGLPVTEMAASDVTRNQTGMAFYNGTEWHHLWCTANEGLRSGADPREVIEPAEWHYLGSRVLERSRERIVIWSGHGMVLDGVPLGMDRYLYYHAGDPYFVLSVSFRNMGRKAVPYFYLYGDEPWVGNYGSSAGDVGWVKDRLVLYESMVDLHKYDYAGMYDIGNPVIGERPEAFTHIADFVEWLGPNRPDMVYFSNIDTRLPDSRVPLGSSHNRIMVMQWGPRVLKPGEGTTHLMAFGMASTPPGFGLPVKPDVHFDPRFAVR